MAPTGQTSSFLNLPPEIRNRIYGYVLGGKAIHIFWRRFNGIYYLKNRICCAKTSVDDYARSIKAYEDSTATQPIDKRHALCWPNKTNIDNRFKARLLLSCRQVNEEAALIPYAENVFIFGHRLDMCTASTNANVKISADLMVVFEYFMRKRTPRQMSAIKGIVLLNSHTGHLLHNLAYINTMKVKALANLQSLVLLIEMPTIWTGPPCLFGAKGIQYVPGLLEFADLPRIKSVRFCVTRKGYQPLKEHWDWWKAVEERISIRRGHVLAIKKKIEEAKEAVDVEMVDSYEEAAQV